VGKMKPENKEAINKALKWAERQLNTIVLLGDIEEAREGAKCLLEAKVALLDEVGK